MAKTLNFAVVGLGMGGHHCKAIAAAKGARLLAVCDWDEERLRSTAEAYGCKAYVSYRDLLRDPDVDVVNIATESGYHTDMGVQAARAGKHLMVEKPIDITPARVQTLERAVAGAGVQCGCILQLRLDPCNLALKQAIDRGSMGKVLGVHAGLPWYRGPAYYSGTHGAWRGTWKLDGGGSLMNQGIHTIDLMTCFGGPIESVCGFFAVQNHAIEAEDHAVACVKFASGALGTIFTTTCAQPEGAQQFFCFGTKGSFRKRGDTLELYEMGSPRERARMQARFGNRLGAGAASDPMAISSDGHTLLVEDMVRALREQRAPMIPLSSAKHAVEIVHAIYRSGRTGREVRITPVRA